MSCYTAFSKFGLQILIRLGWDMDLTNVTCGIQKMLQSTGLFQTRSPSQEMKIALKGTVQRDFGPPFFYTI